MNSYSTDDTNPPNVDERFKSFDDDDGVVIYDAENDDAWISSTYSVELPRERR